MRAIITNSYYTRNPFLVHWVGRWEDGKKMHYIFYPPFKPYFYSEVNGKIEKIEVEMPSDVPEMRASYEKTWEADVVYPERVLIDLGIRRGVEIKDPKNMNIKGNVFPADYKGISLRKQYIDIETDDNQPINLDRPTGAVLSIAMRDSFTNLTTIYTTIPQEKINTIKIMTMLRKSNEEIRHSLRERGLLNLIPYVGNMDIHVVSFKSEKEMLEAYRKYMFSDDYGEINTGYNIRGFDIPYLQNRAMESIFSTYIKDNYGQTKKKDINLGFKINYYGKDISISHPTMTNFDLYQAYLRLHENDLESASLESVSQIELGIGKVKHTEGYREMYEKEPEKFLIYNYRDVLLCQLLDNKLGLFDFFMMLSDKAGTLDMGKWNATYLIDTLMFRVTHGTDFRMPTHSKKDKVNVPGATVIPPANGIYKNVVVFDFKHLYPRIIRQFNMSYETILFDNEIGENDIHITEIEGKKVGFSGTKKGIMPSTLLQLETERYAIKKRMKEYPPESDEYNILNNEQRSIKEIDNSFYGMTGSEHARLFEPFIQASITYLGRNAIMFAKEITEEIGKEKNMDYTVLYGDTDSIFIYSKKWSEMTTEEAIEDATKLNKMVNVRLIDFVRKYMNTDTCIMEMEFEKLYSVWAQFGVKKQYAGNIVWKDGSFLKNEKFDVKGFDPRRSDRSIYTKDYLMPNLLKKILKDRNDALKFLEEEKNRWSNHKIDPETIGIYISLNKQEYTTNYQQKRAYDNSINYGIKLDRMKGKYRMYFLKGKYDVMAINFDDEIPEKIKKNIDWEAHERRCFTLRVENIEKTLIHRIDEYEEDE